MTLRSSHLRRYVAFLRAINVGGHIVKMDHLRTLFESLGFANVATFIASGNVIFDSPVKDVPEIERQLEHRLAEALGYGVATFIRSTDEVAEIARYKPFEPSRDAGGHTSYIAFLSAPPGNEARRKLMTLRTQIDDFHAHGREVYWSRRTGLGESAFTGALLEKTMGMPATMRNANTVRRLADKLAAPLESQ